MTVDSKFAFYGTLRRGMSNYPFYASDLRYIKSIVLPGFRMYDATEYPYAVKSSNLADTIVVEIMEVLTEATKIAIHDLEINSGYFLDYVQFQNEKFGIYLYSQNFSKDSFIESGDWVQHVTL